MAVWKSFLPCGNSELRVCLKTPVWWLKIAVSERRRSRRSQIARMGVRGKADRGVGLDIARSHFLTVELNVTVDRHLGCVNDDFPTLDGDAGALHIQDDFGFPDFDKRAFQVSDNGVFVTGFLHHLIGRYEQARNADRVGQVKIEVRICLLPVHPVVNALLSHKDDAAVVRLDGIRDGGLLVHGLREHDRNARDLRILHRGAVRLSERRIGPSPWLLYQIL